MTWIRSRVAWGAALIALFALLRALRRLVHADERPAALVVALAVVVVAALVPPTLGGRPASAEQTGWRKALQFFSAAAATALAVHLGAGVMAGAVLGVVAAAAVPVLWRAPQKLT